VAGSAIRSGEQAILAAQGYGPDGSLDDVGIELDPTVLEK
jgi:hypothetical protein